jgi:hypothetical protein
VIERRSEALLAIILAVPAEGFIPAKGYCVGFPIIVMLAPFGMLRPRHLYHSKFLSLLRPSNIVDVVVHLAPRVSKSGRAPRAARVAKSEYRTGIADSGRIREFAARKTLLICATLPDWRNCEPITATRAQRS